MRAKCYVSRASEDSGRAKIGARAKKGKEQGGGVALARTERFAPQATRKAKQLRKKGWEKPGSNRKVHYQMS